MSGDLLIDVWMYGCSRSEAHDEQMEGGMALL